VELVSSIVDYKPEYIVEVVRVAEWIKVARSKDTWYVLETVTKFKFHQMMVLPDSSINCQPLQQDRRHLRVLQFGTVPSREVTVLHISGHPHTVL
jgi:hypothetical protein